MNHEGWDDIEQVRDGDGGTQIIEGDSGLIEGDVGVRALPVKDD